MTLRINRHLMTASTADSGALNTIGMVIHQFGEAGNYGIRVFRGEDLVGRCFVRADPDSGAQQTNVDLARFTAPTGDTAETDEPEYTLHPKGRVVFYASRGRGGYRVVASRMTDDGATEVFDSRRLREGDAFVVRPLRRGEYTVTNTETGARGELHVGRPEGSLFERRDSIPASIGSTVDPERIEAVSGQEVAYRIDAPGRVVVELASEEDAEAGDEAAGERRPTRTRRRSHVSVHPPTGRPPGELGVDYLQGLGEDATRDLAAIGIESVDRLARSDPGAVAWALGASRDRSVRIVEMASLVAAGASDQTAEALTGSGVTTTDLPSMGPAELSARIRESIDEGTVTVPEGYEPDRTELRTVIDRLRRHR
jgi:hypothetical protein